MCIWRFWLRIRSGIKTRSSDLNSWDTLYKGHIWTNCFYEIYTVWVLCYNGFGSQCCLQLQATAGANLKDLSELASLSLDYFTPTNHQLQSPNLPHVRHTSFQDDVCVRSRTMSWNLENPSRWRALTFGWMQSDFSTIRTFNDWYSIDVTWLILGGKTEHGY